MARAERRLEEVRRPSGERPDGKEEPTTAKAAGAYVCPMHPDVRQDRPGTCPKCGAVGADGRISASPLE
jgi:hypothetical protein